MLIFGGKGRRVNVWRAGEKTDLYLKEWSRFHGDEGGASPLKRSSGARVGSPHQSLQERRSADERDVVVEGELFFGRRRESSRLL